MTSLADDVAMCSEDQVYMGDHELCKQYVLSDVGNIFYGNEHQISAKPWNYGQVGPTADSETETIQEIYVRYVLPGPKIAKAFLICSGAQRNFAHTFVLTLPTDLPSQIFHLG